MRNLRQLDPFRVTNPQMLKAISPDGWAGDETCGMFIMISNCDGGVLRIIAAAGEGWDHVSVSRIDRIPTWSEMEQVAEAFFKPQEHAMQLHLPRSEHINCHPFCLHWWRPHLVGIPLPPANMVGPKGGDDDAVRGVRKE